MFDELIGNESVKRSLKNLIKTNRIPHSSLFVGHNGIGKRLFAFELAKALVCQKSKYLESCNQCTSCQRAVKFNLPTSEKKEDYLQVFFSEHPDIGIIIPNKKTIYIDAIRQLEAEANYLPYESKARFFIVDEAEKMTPQASNALLKTLEEPAQTTYIFLITSRPSSLLPTIRSRCQIVRFAPINRDEVEAFLFESGNFSSKDSKLAANLSRGSIGNALAVDMENFKRRREKMFGVLEYLISRKNSSALLQTSEEMTGTKDKLDYERYLETLQILIRDLWLIKQINGTKNVINFDLITQLEYLLQKIETATLASWISEIETLRMDLNFNLNRKIATDALFAKMSV